MPGDIILGVSSLVPWAQRPVCPVERIFAWYGVQLLYRRFIKHNRLLGVCPNLKCVPYSGSWKQGSRAPWLLLIKYKVVCNEGPAYTCKIILDCEGSAQSRFSDPSFSLKCQSLEIPFCKQWACVKLLVSLDQGTGKRSLLLLHCALGHLGKAGVLATC